MKAVQFRYNPARLGFAKVMGLFSPRAYLSSLGPLVCQEIPDPVFLSESGTVVRTRLCGICGSDTKQVFMDADFDNPLTTMVSFPMVLGHEVVGVIKSVAPGETKRQTGERVVLNPWLSCEPRGIQPLCAACRDGNYFLCENFQAGHLAKGMHSGKSSTVTGGYAPILPALQSMPFPI